MKAQIGLIGLGVMGENLLMNMESKGFTVACYNRSTDKVANFIEGRAKGKNIIGAFSLEELVASLAKPRKVMIMVKAGGAVDSMIESLIPLLEEGDIIIDGGNSHFPDTIRRTKYVEITDEVGKTRVQVSAAPPKIRQASTCRIFYSLRKQWYIITHWRVSHH